MMTPYTKKETFNLIHDARVKEGVGRSGYQKRWSEEKKRKTSGIIIF